MENNRDSVLELFLKQDPRITFSEPWPDFARNATARILALWFPSVAFSEWHSVVNAQKCMDALMYKFSDPRVAGRLVGFMDYCISELKNDADIRSLELIKHSKEMKWTKKLSLQNGKEIHEVGTGWEEMIKDYYFRIIEDVGIDQVSAARRYYRAKNAKKKLRSQNARSLKVYFIFVLMWPTIQNYYGKPLKQLYKDLYPILPQAEHAAEMDFIDIEDQHFKWFEKLCYRSIGFHPKPKGKRIKRIQNKPPTL